MEKSDLRKFYDENKVELNKMLKFTKLNLYFKLKKLHPDWDEDDVKFNIYYMTIELMTYIHDKDNFIQSFTKPESSFGLDELGETDKPQQENNTD